MSYLLKDSIGYRTNHIATTIKTNFTKILQAKCGIATEQFATLKIIDEDNDVTQTRIAELLAKDKTTVGRSIESLLKKDLLSVENVESDRRANKISLTPKAQEVLKIAVPLSQKFTENVKSNLTKDELKTFYKVLDVILQESMKMSEKEK